MACYAHGVMRVAGVQLDIAWEDPDENLRRADLLVTEAVAQGARLVALPEMFATGFSMHATEMARHAAEVRSFLSELARQHHVWVIGGYAEPGEPAPFNACAMYGPDGAERLHYRKIHPFTLADEHLHYGAGSEVLTTEADGLRITPLICYDLRFPRLFDARAMATDLFVVIANWPDRRRHAWRTLLVARAIDTQAYVLGVNRVGTAQGYIHRGDSALIDPLGNTLASATDVPGAVVGDVDPANPRTVRGRYGFLRDRRPAVYRRLEEEV